VSKQAMRSFLRQDGTKKEFQGQSGQKLFNPEKTSLHAVGPSHCDQTFCVKMHLPILSKNAQNGALLNENFCQRKHLVKIREFNDKN
jgi:hypothetical protein